MNYIDLVLLLSYLILIWSSPRIIDWWKKTKSKLFVHAGEVQELDYKIPSDFSVNSVYLLDNPKTLGLRGRTVLVSVNKELSRIESGNYILLYDKGNYIIQQVTLKIEKGSIPPNSSIEVCKEDYERFLWYIILNGGEENIYMTKVGDLCQLHQEHRVIGKCEFLSPLRKKLSIY